jgi:hypothetical protein
VKSVPYARYRLRSPGTVPGVLAYEGDSITVGFDPASADPIAWAGSCFPARAQPFVNGCVSMFNLAVNGATVASMAGRGVSTDAYLQPTGAFGTGPRSCLFVMCGRNDAAAMTPATTILAELQAYVAARFAGGWEKVVLSTIFGGAGAIQTAVNAGIRLASSWTVPPSVICDPAADSRLLAGLSPYSADGTHLTANGNSLMAIIASVSVNEAING